MPLGLPMIASTCVGSVELSPGARSTIRPTVFGPVIVIVPMRSAAASSSTFSGFGTPSWATTVRVTSVPLERRHVVWKR